MEKLNKVIEQYGRWGNLSIYTERIEAHINSDFSHALENAKGLLEPIVKGILKLSGLAIDPSISINAVLKKVFIAIGYAGDSLVVQISGSLYNIGNQLGEFEMGEYSYSASEILYNVDYQAYETEQKAFTAGESLQE